MGIVMTVSQGMQREMVLTTAGQLDADQQMVTDLMQRTLAAVNTLGQNWFGNDSTQFASDWASYSKQLQTAADAISAMSRMARTQASDQQSTSAS
jgi:uncharacterized protein YukE